MGCLNPLCITRAGNVQYVRGPDGKPIEAILYGIGAQATFQNTAGQVVVVTNNSPGTVSIPINSNGDPSIPAGSNLSVVSNNPSIPSTPTSSPPGRCGKAKWSNDGHLCLHTSSLPPVFPHPTYYLSPVFDANNFCTLLSRWVRVSSAISVKKGKRSRKILFGEVQLPAALHLQLPRGATTCIIYLLFESILIGSLFLYCAAATDALSLLVLDIYNTA